MSQGLAQAGSSRAAARRLVEAVGVQMGWPVTDMRLADENRRLLTCHAQHLPPGQPLRRFAVDEVEPRLWLPAGVYQRGRLLWIPDLAPDTASARSRIAQQAGLHVAVGVPNSAGGQTLDALCVHGDRVEDREDTLIAPLGDVVGQVGQ